MWRKASNDLRFEKRAQQRDLHFARGAVLRRDAIRAVPHPVPDARVLDVHELRADRVRINALERGDHLAQRHPPVIEEEFRGDLQIEILFAEAELAQREKRIFRALVRQRIHPRDRVTERAISVNQTVDARLQRALRSVHPAVRLTAAPFVPSRLPSSNPSKNADQPGRRESGSFCQRS